MMVRFAVLFALLCAPAAGAQSVLEDRQTPNTLRSREGASAPASLADFGWLIGHWRGTGLGGVSEEVWTAPAGGAMMGMYRLITKDAVTFYEFLTLVEENGSLALRLKHFNPDMTGWEEKDGFVTFRLVRMGPGEAYFGGLTFRRIGDDRLDIFLALRERSGTIREEKFEMQRVK